MNWILKLLFEKPTKKQRQTISRKHGCVPSKEDKRDYVLGVPQTTNVIPDQHVIPMPPIRNQGSLQSCTAFGAIACVESILQNIYPNKFVELSELYAYYHARKDVFKTFPSDSGAPIRDALQAIKDFGIAPEVACAYQENASYVPHGVAEAFAQFYKINTYARVLSTDDIIAAIASGKPVVCGIWIKEDFYQMTPFSYQYHMTGTKNYGGHCVCIYGYDKTTKTFAIRNSWGPAWGNNGNFLMDIDTFAANSFDWFTVDVGGENSWIQKPQSKQI
jgi:C1A family cysteine protease